MLRVSGTPLTTSEVVFSVCVRGLVLRSCCTRDDVDDR